MPERTRRSMLAAALAAFSAAAMILAVAPTSTAASPGVGAAPSVLTTTKAVVPASVSIKAAATTLTYKGKVSLSGVLKRRDTGAGLPSKTLAVYQQAFGTTTWSKIATVKTGSGGKWSYSRTQTKGLKYRVVHTATTTVGAATSTSVTVKVKAPLISNKLSPAAATVGLVRDVRTWSGSTSSSNGSKILVQQLKGSAWSTIASGAVAANKFSIRFRTSTAGTVSYGCCSRQ